MTFKSFRGKEITSVFDDLAKLRILVFRAFPYLYEGTLAYEKEYLKVYSVSEKSLLFTVYDDSEMVGATTCVPLSDESDDVKKPFVDAEMDISKIFYLGESILLPEYRRLGIGNQFFEEREKHAKSFGQYNITSFCAVQRPDNHPLKPNDYRPLDEFWRKRGYEKSAFLQTKFDWIDIGNTVSSEKPMLFWTKNI
jgi:GNAT superfamily N-acetyltransferase